MVKIGNVEEKEWFYFFRKEGNMWFYVIMLLILFKIKNEFRGYRGFFFNFKLLGGFSWIELVKFVFK